MFFGVPIVMLSGIVRLDEFVVPSLPPTKREGLALHFPMPATFDPAIIKTAIESRAVGLGIGCVGEGEDAVFTFRLQFGGVQVYALLDPSDETTRELRAGWAQSGMMRFVIATPFKSLVLSHPDSHQLGKSFETRYLPSTPAHGWSFLRRAIDLQVSGVLAGSASSDIPVFPTLDGVYVFITVTERHRALLERVSSFIPSDVPDRVH